jgi:hypothetical protein
MNPFHIITHDLPELEHVAILGQRGGPYLGFVQKREGKRPLGPRHSWDDNIKMNLQEVS